MPKSRQQTTPRQAPHRAAKRCRSEAADTPNASASGSKAVSRRGSAAAASSSGKKQKVQAEQAEQVGVPASANDKENTPGGSEPRRSTRTRTARHVQEVTPGPGLVRPAKDTRGSTGRGAASSTQKKQRQTSAGRQFSTVAQGKAEAASAERASQSDKGADPVVTSPQRTAPALQPDGSPLQELTAQLVPTGANLDADALPSAHDNSSQVKILAPQETSAPYQSPEQPVSLAPPATHHSQPHLACIPPQQLQSSLEPGSPAAAALAAACPAPGPSSVAADPIPMIDPVGDHSSQEGSRHSSGHSNDHPTALMARKHLNWDSTCPSSGPTSGINKPPLNKGVTQPAQTGPSSPAAADVDETWWDPTDMHKVQAVRGVLHVAAAALGQVPLCRQTQVADLQAFLGQGIQECRGGSIYVSGVPGTGKSLVVHELMRQCHSMAAGSDKCSLPPAVVSINCMSLPTPQAIFGRILAGLAQATQDAGTSIVYPAGAAAAEAASTGDQALEALQAVITQPLPDRSKTTPSKRKMSSHGMMIVICDEMDQLMSSAQEVLYDLFFMPQLLKSRLILVGIANSLDLTERLLPGLEARGCKPRLVAFPTYTRTQISTVLQERLQSLPGPVFAAKALEFCARKMAAATGDMRRALEACTAALELKVQEAVAEEGDLTANALVAKGSQRSQDDTDTQTQLTVLSESQQAQQGMDRLAQQPGPGLSLQAQQGLPPGGLLIKPKPVGIGHMCRAISTLTGGVGTSSTMVQAVKNLPGQQQLLICAATKLLGGHKQEPANSAANHPTTSGLSGLPRKAGRDSTGSFNSGRSVSSNRRDSMSPVSSRKGLTGSPFQSRGLLKNSPASSRAMASPSSRGSPGFGAAGMSPGASRAGLARMHDCSMGQLHDAYSVLCRKVAFCPLTSGEVSSACSTLSDQGILQMSSQQGDRRCRITLRVSEDDVLAAVVDNRLLSNCLSL